MVVTSAPAVRMAAVVYALTLVGMFATSAAYHRGRWSPAGRRRMKLADHTAIFMFIAGSYTMFATLMLPPPWRYVVVAVLWVGAAGGSWLKLRRLHRTGGIADVCYLVLGWFGVLTFPYLLRAAPLRQVALLVAGGALYSLGAAVLGLRRPDPSPLVFGYHEVGHALTVAGVACHYALYLWLAAGW